MIWRFFIRDAGINSNRYGNILSISIIVDLLMKEFWILCKKTPIVDDESPVSPMIIPIVYA